MLRILLPLTTFCALVQVPVNSVNTVHALTLSKKSFTGLAKQSTVTGLQNDMRELKRQLAMREQDNVALIAENGGLKEMLAELEEKNATLKRENEVILLI
jgi:delta 1-pyrroline-5-carboxylate dehydrogenase